MSNLPLGAEYDPNAPYNEEEKVFKFDLNVKGIAYWCYNGYLDVDEAQQAIKERLLATLSQLGDIDIITSDVAVY